MNKKDLYVALVIAAFTALVAFFVSGMIFNSPKNRQTKVPVITKISPDFADTYKDPTYTMFYNSKAINPTELIKIGVPPVLTEEEFLNSTQTQSTEGATTTENTQTNTNQ